MAPGYHMDTNSLHCNSVLDGTIACWGRWWRSGAEKALESPSICPDSSVVSWAAIAAPVAGQAIIPGITTHRIIGLVDIVATSTIATAIRGVRRGRLAVIPLFVIFISFLLVIVIVESIGKRFTSHKEDLGSSLFIIGMMRVSLPS